MKNSKKYAFLLGVATMVVAAFAVASVTFGWTNPSAAPVGSSGALRADASGNVRIGGFGPPSNSAKLEVSGSLLVDAGSSLTLGGVSKSSWPIGAGSTMSCSSVASINSGIICITAGVSKVYFTYSNVGTSLTKSASTSGVIPTSPIVCDSSVSGGYPAITCQVVANDIIYPFTATVNSTATSITVYTPPTISVPGVVTSQ
jgi:hypothetical protein